MKCRIENGKPSTDCPYGNLIIKETHTFNFISHCVAIGTPDQESGITQQFIGEECPEKVHFDALQKELYERSNNDAA